jgi:hypothetical protein
VRIGRCGGVDISRVSGQNFGRVPALGFHTRDSSHSSPRNNCPCPRPGFSLLSNLMLARLHYYLCRKANMAKMACHFSREVRRNEHATAVATRPHHVARLELSSFIPSRNLRHIIHRVLIACCSLHCLSCFGTAVVTDRHDTTI